MKRAMAAILQTLAVLGVFAVSLVQAEDFKTVNGKEYKNATVSRVEPDGIVLNTKSGISKVYFVELPKEVQERFHYDAAKGVQFTAVQQTAIAESNAAIAVHQPEEAQERQRQGEAVARQQQEAQEQQRQAEAIAIAMRQQQQQAQAQQRYARQQQQKATARQAAEQERLRGVAAAAASQRTQEDQRIQYEHQRNLERMQREQALWHQQQSVDFARLRNSVMQSADSRENYKREQEQLKQLQDRHHWETGNRAAAY
jgi:hypothetical protein